MGVPTWQGAELINSITTKMSHLTNYDLLPHPITTWNEHWRTIQPHCHGNWRPITEVTFALLNTQKHTHTHTHTRARAHTHTHTRARARARTHTVVLLTSCGGCCLSSAGWGWGPALGWCARSACVQTHTQKKSSSVGHISNLRIYFHCQTR